MPAIPENRWGEAVVYTWGDLSNHQWMDFRLALMDVTAEMATTGVAVEYSSAEYEIDISVQAHGVKVVESPVIMEAKAEMITSIVVSERDYKANMIRYLPLYERRSGLINEVLKSYDRQFRKVGQSIQIADRGLFIDTAVESLPLYERDLGIEPDTRLAYDQRREQVSSRFRAAFDQTTEETIKLVASAYSHGEVEVNKTDSPGLFEIKFVGTKGIPNNMTGLKKALDIVMPAHLGLTYTFIYNTWQDAKRYTWDTAARMTWNDIRTVEEVRSA